MSKQLRILAVGAHPDDVEICRSGTLALYAQAGHHVMMGYATNGDKGHLVIPPDELAEIREQAIDHVAELTFQNACRFYGLTERPLDEAPLAE